MDHIDRITALYQGSILLHPSYEGEWPMDIPKELQSILRVSNGIEETMLHPKTGEQISIGWVVYPYDMMMEENSFYKEEYGLDGFVFADNGAGEPYLLKADGTVACYDPICGEESRAAASLSEFFSSQ